MTRDGDRVEDILEAIERIERHAKKGRETLKIAILTFPGLQS